VGPSARLVPLSDDLWVADGPNVAFFRLCYPTRMVVARLPDVLWIWSPVALEPALRQSLDALGEVAWLVSPNKIHHLFLAPWQAAYPRAQLCRLAQVAGKRRDLTFDRLLDDQPPPAWAGHIDQVVVRGSDFRTSFLRRQPARAALATIMVWAPQRVIMAHGAMITEDAVAFLERSFRWLK
jgi:hypothetical protein